MVEMVAVLAIIAVLAGLTYSALSRIKSTAGRRSMATDLYSEVSMARSRARAKERTQIIVIDATSGTNQTYGYYHFEDAATPPAIFTSADLVALLTAMVNPPTVPAGYTLTLLESRTNANNGYYMNADGWSGVPPFPWSSLAVSSRVSTVNGCSFCSASGYGAVALLPSGRAVFSDGNTLGGLIVIQGDTAGGQTTVRTGIGVATSGFVQQVEHP